MDKDHYNTFELISHPEKDFKNHGHNKIFQYCFLIIIGLVSFKIIFFYVNKMNNLYIFFIFFLILFSDYQFLFGLPLDNLNSFNLIYFYSINFMILILTYFFIGKILK